MKNSTSILAKVRKWTEEHKEEVKERKRKYKRKNKEAIAFSTILYQEEHPELIKKQEEKHHEKDRLKINNWTNTLKQEALTKQDKKCAICGADKNSTCKDWAADHDHKNGNIRGILCNNCNTALGFFQDDPERMRKAARYIEFYKKQGNKYQFVLFKDET